MEGKASFILDGRKSDATRGLRLTGVRWFAPTSRISGRVECLVELGNIPKYTSLSHLDPELYT